MSRETNDLHMKIKELLLQAPDRQLDASMLPLIRAWDNPPKAIQILEVTDKCACFGLASNFVMLILNRELEYAFKREGFEGLDDFRARVTCPWMPLV